MHKLPPVAVYITYVMAGSTDHERIICLFMQLSPTTHTHIYSICTRSDQKVPRLIFLLGCGYTSGHPCLQGGVLELPLSLGQGMVPARLSVLCELRLK